MPSPTSTALKRSGSSSDADAVPARSDAVSDLTACARDHYDAIKDFAGPGATVMASFAAAVVAYMLGRSQRKIAELQAAIAERTWKTANDKIVLELFQPRMEIYDAVSAVVGKSHTGKPPPNELYFEFSQ